MIGKRNFWCASCFECDSRRRDVSSRWYRSCGRSCPRV